MSHSVVELRPDQKLLIKHFEGYKLSLDTVPVIKHKINPNVAPCVIVPNIDQYSLLHAKLYGFHNHLYKDPWEPYTTYVVHSNNLINKLVFNAETQRFLDNVPSAQFAIPQTEKDKLYNASMKFMTEKYLLFSGGSSTLYIIDTTERLKLKDWKIVFSGDVMKDVNGFVILDARFDEIDEKHFINCLLLHIEKGEKIFQNVIEWITFERDQNLTWHVSNQKTLTGSGALHYCALEHKSKAVYIASDHRYKFKLCEPPSVCCKINESQTQENDVGKFSITWHQSEEEVTLFATFKEFVDKTHLNINSDNDSLKISYNSGEVHETSLLLFEKIDNDLTTWNMLDANNLEIQLYKITPTCWKSLTKVDEEIYKEVPNPVVVSEVHDRLKHLCTETQNEASVTSSAPIQDEIDDCDFDSDYDTKDLTLERLCPETKTATHCINVGPSAPLFQLALDPQAPSILALRYDVDALVWQMPNTSTLWPPKHVGTLPAFGYVQASKQQKKFISCSPDFKYSVICNANRHLFLYWGGNSGGELQNRKSKQLVQIGVQKVVTLDEVGEIIGLQTENDLVMLLTMDYIIALQV